MGSDIFKESVGGPPAQEHDLGDGVVHEEEAHRRAGADRLGPDVGGIITKDGSAA